MRAAKCAGCKDPVAEGQGYLYGPPWTVKCERCAVIVPRVLSITVTLDADGKHASFRANAHLGDKFDAYRKAIEPARYAGDGVNRIGIDKAASVIARLNDAGFVLDLQPGLVEAATAAAEADRLATGQALATASANSDAIDARLRARGLSLFPFQRAGAAWLATRYGALLADQMGLGKTITALAALPTNAPVIVIGPAVAKGVWCREIAAWRPDLKASALSGFGSFRWPQPGEVVVTNYDILRSGIQELLAEEAHEPSTENVTEPVNVHAGDELKLLQKMPDGLFQLRTRQKSSWKVLQTSNDFYSILNAYRAAPLDRNNSARALMIGLTGTERTLIHSEPGKGELTVDAAFAIDHGVRRMGVWAQTHRQAGDLPLTTTGFQAVIEAERTGVDGWHSIAKWTHMSRMRTIDHRSIAVPKGVTRIRVRWTVSGETQTFGIGYTRKTLEGQPVDGTVLILDEAHACKNSKAERTEHVTEIATAVRSHKGRVWALTATPMLNRPPELWCILRIAEVANEAFGSWKRFADLMGGEQGNFGWTWDGPVSSSVPELLRRVSLRRERAQVLPELPEKMWQTVPVDIDKGARSLCDKAEEILRSHGIDLRAEVSPEQLQRATTLAFKEISSARAALASAKIPAMLELVESYEEQNEPLVVFSAHRAPIDLLGKRDGWAVITGDESAEERTATADAFQSGKLQGVALTIRAGGVAITLTRAAHALFVDRDWNPGINDQAEDRICRIGQTRGVVIHTLVADHALDARVSEILATKRTLVDHTVSASATVEAPPVVVEAAVDLDRIAAESRKQLDAERAAVAEAERLAAEHAAKRAQEAEKTKAEQKAAERESKALARARARGWVQDENHPERHAPQTPAEHWAAHALVTLSRADPDYAHQQNGVGFNKGDSYIGHWLGLELPMGLTNSQWMIAINTCRKYQGQVGPCPQSTNQDCQTS